MAEAIVDAMGEVLARWTIGTAAAPAASMWNAELGDAPGEAELRLLGLSSQFLGVAVTVDPPVGLRTLPDIPVLALPTVPDGSRPLVRRILASAKEKRLKTELLDFLVARGWTVHPGDWLPTTSDEDAPDIYAPWLDWADIAMSANAARQKVAGSLTVENWDDYWPAARKVALSELRQRDPDAARLLLEAKLAGESAEMRLSLLGLLKIGLSDPDIPFLESIVTNDRAPKVKALAASLLARLGHGPGAGEDAAELASFFSVHTKGVLRHSRVIQFENAKTAAQLQRRAALLESVDIVVFTGALGLAPDELIAAWSFDVDRLADTALIAMIARAGTDALVVLAAETLSQSNAEGLRDLATLAPRLAPEERRRLAAKILGTHGCSFETAKAIAGAAGRIDNPIDVRAGAALLETLGRDDVKPSDQVAELYALGLIASRAGARQALERLSGAHLLQGDPRLDMLRLNAALDDNGAQK
jgi:Family of unknown function (DUF5691)